MSKDKFDGTTHISVVMDRSGSMIHLVDETISGYNAWLIEAKKAYKGQKARLSLQLFDDKHEWPVVDSDLQAVDKLTPETYFVRGWTALRDAFGSALMKLDKAAKKSDRVLCVVITDGLENASREISDEALRELIAKAEKRKGWEIIYLGSNQDALAVGLALGNRRGSNISTQSTPAGTAAIYRSASVSTRNFASGQSAAISQEMYDSSLDEEEKTTKGSK